MARGAPPTSPVRYSDLGPMVLLRDQHPTPVNGRRLTSLLGALLVNVNQRVTSDQLVEALWGDDASGGASTTLISHLYRLRKLVGPAAIVTEDGSYRLVAPRDQVDSTHFEDLAGVAREHRAAGDHEAALRLCDEALALWRGRPWTPHSDEDWAAAATGRLEELHTQVRELRVESLLGVGRPEEALVDVDGIVAEYPLREHGWTLRMLANYQLGRTNEALSAFQSARTILADELGIDPGPELQEVQQRILAGDPTLAGPRRPPAAEVVPPPVHLPRTSGQLFGREEAVQAVAASLVKRPLVSIIGPSGCGKTRVALEAARRVVDTFPDGVWYVDTTSATDATAVTDAILTTVRGGDPRAPDVALQNFFRDRRVLLVLHTSPSSLPAVREVLIGVDRGDVGTTVVVTTGEPLSVESEWTYALAPLPVPTVSTRTGPTQLADLAEEPAIKLFVARAGAVGMPVQDGDLPMVAQICAAVDGLPLAIELAAARTRSFTLDEIVDWVTDDLASISGATNASSAGLVELLQSAAMLRPTDLVVHQSASVIPGAFTPASVAAVAGLSTNDAREALGSLVHRSLMTPLGAREPGGSSRFSQLAVVRSAADGSLDPREREEYADRRNAWVGALAEQVPRLGSVEEWDWFARVDDDEAAIRATLQDALIDRPSSLGGTVAASLFWYWWYRGEEVDLYRWTRRTTTSEVATERDRVQAHLGLAGVGYLSAREDHAAQALAVLDAADDVDPLANGDLLFGLVSAAAAAGAAAAVVEAARRLRRLAEETSDPALILFADVSDLIIRLGLQPGPTSLERAATLQLEADRLRNHYAGYMIAVAGTVAAVVAEDPPTGIGWSNRALRHVARAGAGSAFPLVWRSRLLTIAGQYREAATTLAVARTYCRRMGRQWPMDDRTAELIALVEAKLDPDERASAIEAGQRLTLSELVSTI